MEKKPADSSGGHNCAAERGEHNRHGPEERRDGEPRADAIGKVDDDFAPAYEIAAE